MGKEVRAKLVEMESIVERLEHTAFSLEHTAETLEYMAERGWRPPRRVSIGAGLANMRQDRLYPNIGSWKEFFCLGR